MSDLDALREKLRAERKNSLIALRAAIAVLRSIRADGYAGDALPDLDWALDGEPVDGKSLPEFADHLAGEQRT